MGPLLENFVIGEVARQLTWAEEPVQLFHYRDRDQVEVDIVLEARRSLPGRHRPLRRRAAAFLRGPANRPADGRTVDARRLGFLTAGAIHLRVLLPRAGVLAHVSNLYLMGDARLLASSNYCSRGPEA